MQHRMKIKKIIKQTVTNKLSMKQRKLKEWAVRKMKITERKIFNDKF